MEDSPIKKICTRCLKEKTLDEFGPRLRHPICKDCERDRKRSYARLHPEQKKASNQKQYAQAQERRQQDDEYDRAYKLRKRRNDKYSPVRDKRKRLKRFNLSIQQYEAMLQEQKGCCAICNTCEEGKLLAVDHDHVTGQVRGLLCTHCNLGLGTFKDNPDLLLKAISYLQR